MRIYLWHYLKLFLTTIAMSYKDKSWLQSISPQEKPAFLFEFLLIKVANAAITDVARHLSSDLQHPPQSKQMAECSQSLDRQLTYLSSGETDKTSEENRLWGVWNPLFLGWRLVSTGLLTGNNHLIMIKPNDYWQTTGTSKRSAQRLESCLFY